VPTTADQARTALGVHLRDIRRDAGLSGTQLALVNGWRPSKVSKIEHGNQTPTESDLSNWCTACDATDQLPDLIAAVRSIETQYAEWRRTLRTGTKRRQEASAKVYEQARLFRIWEPAVIPGLLQTMSYATAVLSITIDFHRIPDDAEEGARVRLERQRVLSDDDRRFHFIVGQQALHTNVGGPEVMAEQLRRLLDRLKFPHIRLGFVPLDAPYRVPLHDGFWILDDALVQVDTYTGELSLARPDEIDLYARAFERLTALAIYGTEARQLVSATLEKNQAKILAAPG
jgi:transcriptional regulator with XRE-family HTH domain